MKKISVMIPCYNEEENVREICAAVIDVLEKELSSYDYEILFIDNCSQDKTREYLREMCKKNPKVKAIFNAKNFGQFNSPVYGMCQTTGDCTISLCCDFQDPVELIPVFVKEWENGYKIVSGIKTGSKENKIMRFLRTCYYKMIKKMSDVEQIEHFTGFGLYDKSFIEVLRNLKDPTPFIRGIVAELGYKRKDIPYTQPKRKAGKTHNNWATLYDAAMLSFTSYTKVGLRIATIIGFIFSMVSLIVAFDLSSCSSVKFKRSSSITSGRFMIRLFILITYSPNKPIKNNCADPRIHTASKIGIVPATNLSQKTNFIIR